MYSLEDSHLSYPELNNSSQKRHIYYFRTHIM